MLYCQSGEESSERGYWGYVQEYPPPFPWHNHPIQTKTQKSSKDLHLCRTTLQYIIPLERYPFPPAGFMAFRARSCFFTLAWAPAANFVQLDLPCNNWDLTLTAEQTRGFQEYCLLVRDDHLLLQTAAKEFTYTGRDTKKPLTLSFTSILARRTDSLSSSSPPFFKFHFQVTHQTTQDNLLMHTSQSLYKG